MNHVYRSIYNAAVGAWVAVAENARAQGKGRNIGTSVTSMVMLGVFSVSAHALPGDGQVSAGSGTMSQNGSSMTVNQGSQNMAINWQTYNIGSGETVNYVQPNASSIALNRVLGSDPSRILGNLNANGQVWLLNPSGVLFGRGAQVNVGGLVASTLNISDADFLAGKRTFSGSGGAVTNRGAINAGYVALLGGQVSNEGVITAQLGTVALAAGKQITLDFNGDKLLNVQVDQGVLDALAQNKQLIRADGGTVLMTAQAADALATAVVNNTGVIEARSIENHNGVIKLLGDMRSGTVNVGGTLDASAPSPNSVRAELVEGQAASTSSGQASTSSARTAGDRAVANGGFIETSAAHVQVADNTQVTTAAFNGLAGTWLIDPIDFTIAAGSGALTTSGIGASTLSTNLGGGNIAIATNATTAGNGDIFVNSAVSWSANKLTLTAHRNIAINANLNGSGTASLALEYGQAAAGGGGSDYTFGNGAQVNLPAGANFSTKLGTGGATTSYTVITGLGVAGDATAAPAAMTLQGMKTGLTGKYALGANIDASTTNTWNAGAGFTPVGGNLNPPAVIPDFTGIFDGLGHTISGLTVNNAGTDFQGLFGYSTTGTLRNIGLLNSSISGRSGVATLAGLSNGTISYSYADGGSVTGNWSGNSAGGLMGGGSGSISNSYANVSVTGVNTGTGGLKGNGTGSVNNSYATGRVTGVTDTGGLVGQCGGNISNSYATGTVSATGLRVGGLVGSQTGGSVTNSYWDKVTSGQATSSGSLATAGKTTAEMQTQSTFTGFDFTTVPVWRIYAGQTYPLLKSFLTPLTVTGSASKTYDGLAYSGGNGVSYSIAPNANLLGTVSYSGGGTNVGSYTITPSGLYSNQRGYDISYANGTLTVNAAPLTVSANAASKTYDGLAWSGNNGVSYSGFVNGQGTGVLSGTLAYGGTAQGAVNAGSYLITPSGLTSGNYAINYVNGALTVNPAPLSVTANAASKTYDGLAYSGGNGVGYRGFVNGETSAVLGGALVYVGTSQGAVNAGNYTITPSGLSGGNYAISYVNGTLKVNAAPLTITASTASKTYDGLAYSGGNGVSYSGLANGETSAVLGGALAYGGTAQGAVHAGSYLITPSGLTSGNYAINYVNGALTVNPAPLSVTANAASKTYDGLAYSGGNGVGYSGFVNGETSAVLGGALTWGGTAQGAVNAGSYTLIPGGLSGGNYRIVYVNGVLTVNAAPLTVAANAVAKTYDGLAYNGGNGVGYSGFVNGETAAVLGGALAYGGTAQGAINAGSYVIRPGGLTGGNYAISYADGALTVNPAPLTVTANATSKTYNGLAYSGGNGVSYSGLVNGETSAVLGGALAYGGTAQGAVNAGSYVISPSGLTSGNYAINYVNGALTVNPAALSVNAIAANKTYNGLAYSGGNGVSYSGLVNGETAAALGGALAYGGTAQGAIKAGSYSIIPGGLTSNNYRISYGTGTLTVNPAPLSVSANAANKTYDGLAYSGGNGVAYSGLVNGETSAVLGGALAYGGTAQGAVNAGSYLITPSGLTSGNYAINYVNGALAVNAAPLAVTANSASKIYDGLAYSGGNGVSYNGLVNGETSAVLGGALAWSGTAQGAVNVGDYTLVPGGLSSGNYSITFNDSKLNIGARVPATPGAPINGYAGAIASTGVIAANTGTTTGAAGNTAAGASVVALAVESADSAASSQGESGVVSLSAEGVATDYFSTRYVLVMHDCGLRLPTGLSCR